MFNALQIESALAKDDIELHVLNETHIPQLEKLAQDERIWKFATHEHNRFKEEWIDKAITQMQQNKRLCLVIFYQGNIVGSTSYYHIDLDNKKLTIGHTWLHPNHWGSKINRVIKLMMLEYAFDKLGFIRVEFQVDSLNIPSQNALQKIGIKHEGILRNHMLLSNGRIRNTYVYSVIPEEWPMIKQNIERMLS
ncbi:MAG: GNAT family protein [Gammaproteobacteria bacterium]|nr:GNAT family protein [Gammaproteobacteria bacterium]